MSVRGGCHARTERAEKRLYKMRVVFSHKSTDTTVRLAKLKPGTVRDALSKERTSPSAQDAPRGC